MLAAVGARVGSLILVSIVVFLLLIAYLISYLKQLMLYYHWDDEQYIVHIAIIDHLYSGASPLISEEEEKYRCLFKYLNKSSVQIKVLYTRIDIIIYFKFQLNLSSK